MRICFYLVLIVFSFNSSAQSDTVSIVSYNLLNFPDGRNDCINNVVVPDRSDTLRKILGYLEPDIFVGCEIQTEAGADSVLTRSLNVFGKNNYAQANFNLSSTLNNCLYYNTDKLTLQYQDQIVSSPRNIDHYVLYCNDPNLGVYYDTTFIEVYMCHLKAGSSSSNEADRAAQTQILKDFIDSRPSDRNHYVCGDLNVYSSNEAGYQNLVSGTNGLVDPINSPGNWNNNSSFAALHTQSTRTSLNFDCGSKGGSDDRFDQILVSQNVINGADSLRYLSGSYDAVGNDGNHFNGNLISTLGTSSYPDSVVRALYYMSDHLPVALKAVVTYPTSNGLALYPVVSPVSCPGGSDGTAQIVPNDGQSPYSYQWDSSAGNQTSQTAVNLSGGSYCVIVTDALGEVDDYCLIVPEPDPFSSTVFRQPDQGGCEGEAHMFIEGGTEPYTIEWNDPAQQTGVSAINLCAGSYTATVTDANGCEYFVEVFIDGPSNLFEKSADYVEVYPNPAGSELFISGLKYLSFRVFSSTGQEITLMGSTINPNLFKLDLRSLSEGIYYLHIASDHTFEIIRFVKM
ncbi:MAG: T9SS type A sorting domain-containing protein [Brumimicrobium sp.]|nr:T9SS type A sorting domain-containing protein [Brumimicrobium sp.]